MKYTIDRIIAEIEDYKRYDTISPGTALKLIKLLEMLKVESESYINPQCEYCGGLVSARGIEYHEKHSEWVCDSCFKDQQWDYSMDEMDNES